MRADRTSPALSEVAAGVQRLEGKLDLIKLSSDMAAMSVLRGLMYTASGRSASSSASRTGGFRAKVCKRMFPGGLVTCMVTGQPDELGVGGQSILKAGHVANLKNAVHWRKLLQLSPEDLKSVRNAVVWLSSIEDAFSDSRVAFLWSADGHTLTTHVLDATYLEKQVCEGKKWSDLDGQRWQFVFPLDKQPFKRAFSAHFVLALKRAEGEGWLRKGYSLESFHEQLNYSGTLLVRSHPGHSSSKLGELAPSIS